MKTFIQITALSFGIALFSANISFAQVGRQGGAAPVSGNSSTQTTQSQAATIKSNPSGRKHAPPR